MPQTVFPDWWHKLELPPRLREQLRSSFTIHRDGYVRWYKGAPRFVCSSKTPPTEIEARWADKKRQVDAAKSRAFEPGVITYRGALSEFLEVQKARVGAAKNRIEERTYHNYVVALNDFGSHVCEGVKLADMRLADLGPRQFSSYAKRFNNWKASGFDSVVSRVLALFRWAQEMEYLERFRAGPDFIRPAKQEIRDQRIDLTKRYSPLEVATLYTQANHVTRCFIALGVCAAFNNADVANVTRKVLDLEHGIIDFRRRKVGKVRRVIPLPADVLELLKGYNRPEPAENRWAELFFVTVKGNPYSRTRTADGSYKPNDTISRTFAKLLERAGVKVKGRNFSGLRTTFFNLAPRGGCELERMIIMGRARGTIDLDHYLEEVGIERLRHVVNHVWSQVRAEIDKLQQRTSG